MYSAGLSADFSDYEDDEILPEARIFEFRADNIMKTKDEAYNDFCEKIEKEKAEEILEKEENELFMKVKDKLKPKPRKQRGKAKVDPVEEVVIPPKVTRRRGRKNGEVANLKKKNDRESTTPVNIPSAAKKRLRDLQIKTTRETKIFDEKINRILTFCDETSMDRDMLVADVPLEQSLTLNIRYLSEISKIKVTENETFSNIFPKVADLYNLKASEILLCYGDANIELTDTPVSLKLKSYDIIDCIPYKPVENEVSEDLNKLLIKFQSNDTKKRTDMHTHKLEQFGDVMQRYADLRKLPLRDLVFEFDGEKIDPSETPEDLDMESGSCVDVKVLSYRKKKSPELVDIYDEIPESEMLDICVLD